MLTIDEIKNISFRKATLSGGYRAEDVDAFIDEVIATFEQQKKEKTNLVHKIDRLATRLEEYREDEETVRNALLTSQKMSDACIKEAKEKAARIVRDAEEKAQALVSDANRMTALEKDKYIWVNVEGDSMSPLIDNGSKILVKKQDSVDNGQIGVVLIDGEEAVVKKITYGKNWIELISINPYFPPRRFDGSDVQRVRILGLVKEVSKNLQ